MPKKTQGFLPSVPGGWYRSIGHGIGQNRQLHELEKDAIRCIRGTCKPNLADIVCSSVEPRDRMLFMRRKQ